MHNLQLVLKPAAVLLVVQLLVVPVQAQPVVLAGQALVRRLTGDNATGVVSYGTEAGQFQDAGYSAVVCGPGDIAQAHQADEFIELSEFLAGERFMARLVDHLCQ